jgi:predicted AAA+ superfamily ATPase
MVKRHLRERLVAALKDSPIVFLAGARQTGKSTLVQWVVEDEHRAAYLTLDDLAVLGAARGDPQGFLAGLDGPVALDEVQQAPELFRAIKLAVDRDRGAGRFLLTGSANVMLLPHLAEALVGRVELLTLWPLSQGELEGHRERFVDALFEARLPVAHDTHRKDELVARVLRGGYPEPLTREEPARRESWYQSYLATIIQRDVRELAAIERFTDLPRMLSLLALRSASLLNLAELSRSLAIPQTTLKRYLALLEAAFLALRVPPWFSHSGKRLTKTPKLFLTDSGLLAYLLGLRRERIDTDPVRFGPLLESFVAMELVKQLTWSSVRATLFHFRSHAGKEVDLVLEDAEGRIVGVEVKAAAHVGSGDLSGLRALQELVGDRFWRGVVLYRGRQVVPFGERLHALPIEAIWRIS